MGPDARLVVEMSAGKGVVSSRIQTDNSSDVSALVLRVLTADRRAGLRLTVHPAQQARPAARPVGRLTQTPKAACNQMLRDVVDWFPEPVFRLLASTHDCKAKIDLFFSHLANCTIFGAGLVIATVSLSSVGERVPRSTLARRPEEGLCMTLTWEHHVVNVVSHNVSISLGSWDCQGIRTNPSLSPAIRSSSELLCNMRRKSLVMRSRNLLLLYHMGLAYS
ncbi:uncharacterized protein J3D65DRAFT_207112 [Phyllosticta citribraziliensis]|uniref:Uncharacterized protein n=1 Tax=Phyllosticta citribraziliensis TaxID=989973 RepID=A0ABR1M3S1_9PEZI